MHIAAAFPQYLDRNSVDPAHVEKEKNFLRDQAKSSGKPADIIEKMLEGRMRKFYEEVCLLEQNYIMDPEKKVAAVVADCMALDPRPGLGHPREAANDWALVGIQAANVWEARTNGGGVWLGDVERINELVRALSKQCAQWQIMQEELSLSDRKAAFTRRYAAREVTA